MVLRVLLLLVFILSGCDSYRQERYYLVDAGGERYRVPQGYFWAFDSRKGGVVKGANLHALYPGFQKKTKLNSEIFDRPGWAGGRLVSFIIKDKDKYHGVEKIIENMLSEKNLKRHDNLVAGLTEYETPTGRYNYYFGRWKNGAPVYFRCSRKTQLSIYPSCSTVINSTSKTVLSVSFSRARLGEWENLCGGLVAKLAEFRHKIILDDG